MSAFSKNIILKTTLFMASFFALCLSGCAVDPGADGALFSRSFRYYYMEECRYDAIGPYDCSDVVDVGRSYKVTLRVDSDGFAVLDWDGESYYYTRSQYEEGYDDGAYFVFRVDRYRTIDVKIYKNGSEMSVWDSWNGLVTFYYYE